MTLKQTLACFLSCLLVLGTTPFSAHLAFAADTAASAESGEVYAPLSDDELDVLVAPIALYPDPLLAQVLGAATYPDQVVEANEFLEANSKLSGDALRKATEKKQWDPAVQALTQFPSVVQQLAKNITWTSALGDAAANQQGAIMAAVQRMRAKAQAAGNLTSGKEIKVIQESPQIIVIQPAQPQVIYVPTYNPGVVYGAPIVVPGYTTANVAAATVIAFGAGILIGSAVSSGSCRVGMSWGMSWGVSWSSASIHCGGAPYYGNPYWRGGYYPRYYPGYRPPYYYPPPRPYPPPGYRPPGAYPPKPTQPIARAAATPAKPGEATAGGSSSTGGRPGSGAPGGGGSGAAPGGGAPGGSRPGAGAPPSGPNTRPAPGARPAGPGNLPSTVQPGTRPSGGVGSGPSTPAQQQANRSTRGYAGPTSQPAGNPNAFSGSGGGRQQSARGNHSMSSGAPRGGAAPQPSAAPR